jgi:hypothetical protein
MRNLILLAPLLLCGCLTAAETPAPPITCRSGPDCDAKWSRAVTWVATNSTYKIQLQTAELVQTMGPLHNDPSPAFTVTRTIGASPGISEISLRGGCGNLIGCVPTVAESRAKFNAFVGQ